MTDRDSAADVTVPRAGIANPDPSPAPDHFLRAGPPVSLGRRPSLGQWNIGLSIPPPAEAPTVRRAVVKTTSPTPAPSLSAADTVPSAPPAVPDEPPTQPIPVPAAPPVEAVAPAPVETWRGTRFDRPTPPLPPEPDLTDVLLRTARPADTPARSPLRLPSWPMRRGKRRRAELEAAVRTPLRGPFRVGVVGKGGVGKTTVTAGVGSVLAELRPDGVVAVDADTAFGKLASRLDPHAHDTYRRLLDGPNHTFAEVRSHLGCNASGLFVCAGDPGGGAMLDPAVYRGALSLLTQHFMLAMIDCSTTMDAPVTEEALRDVDALIVVSSPWGDAAEVAARTIDWVAVRGMRDALQRTVVVVANTDGHADKTARATLEQRFGDYGRAVVEIPFDRELRAGGVIDGTAALAGATRTGLLEVAAVLVGMLAAS